MVGKVMTSPTAVRDGILEYLRRHPDASDTLEGIGGWWLTAIDPPPAKELLQTTLDALIAEGKVACIVMLDGKHLYARKRLDCKDSND